MKIANVHVGTINTIGWLYAVFAEFSKLHKVFQNFVVPWKIDIYINLILSSDASRRGASNGVRVA